MKKLKWIVISVVALVVAAAVAVFAILSTMDFEEYRGLIEAKAKEATGRDLKLAGPIDLQVSWSPAISVEQVSFQNAEWGSQADMVSLDRLEVEVELMPLISGDIQVNRVVLVNADILLETDANGTPNWQFETAGGEAGESASAGGGDTKLPTVGTVAIENSRLTYRDGVTGNEMVVGLDNISLSESGPNLDVVLMGSYQGAPFDLSGSLGSLKTLMAGGAYPIDLGGSVAGAEVSVAGDVADIMGDPVPNLAISAAGSSFADFSAMAGSDIPDMGEYSISGQITREGTTYRVAGLDFTLAGKSAKGDISADVSGERPFVTATLTADTLDISQMAAGEGGGEAAAPSDSPYVIPDTPLPLDGLKAADADVKLQIAKLILQEGMEIDAIDLTLSLRGGRLEISPLTAIFSGGAIDLNTVLDGSQETAALDTALSIGKLDYGQLARNLGAGENVEGTLDFTLDISGNGNSPRAIASSLNGVSELLSYDGVITNRLLTLILSGLGDVMGKLMGGDNQAALNCMISRFDIENGLMSSRALALDTETFAVAGKGTIDLKSEQLDLYFDTQTRETALASLAIPFTVKGTLKNPAVAPDPLGTAAALVGGSGDIGQTLGNLGAVGGVAGGLLGGASGTGGGDQQAASDNPCVVSTGGEAIAPAEESATPSVESVVPQDGDVGTAIENMGEDAGKAVEGVTKSLEGLFGN